jgi:hypothetical protein
VFEIPESTDHKAALCLVKSFPKLWAFGCDEENFKISSIINYQAMINQSGLRNLLEDSKGGGGTCLSIWSYVIHTVCEKRNKDPNLVYNFLREGPVIKDRYSFPPTTRQHHQHRKRKRKRDTTTTTKVALPESNTGNCSGMFLFKASLFFYKCLDILI